MISCVSDFNESSIVSLRKDRLRALKMVESAENSKLGRFGRLSAPFVPKGRRFGRISRDSCCHWPTFNLTMANLSPTVLKSCCVSLGNTLPSLRTLLFFRIGEGEVKVKLRF